MPRAGKRRWTIAKGILQHETLSHARGSLADQIALTGAGIDVETLKVDLQTRHTEHGDDFIAVNPKGYVPAKRQALRS
jgi:glutathione S-transferase